MGIYFITLLGTVLCAYCAEYYPISHKSYGRNKLDRTWLFLLLLFLIIISGFRYMNYNQSDEWNYRYMVISALGQPFDLTQMGWNKEWLFYVLIWISANVFKSDQALIFITAVITNTLIVTFFAKYARPFWFAMFLYIVSGSFASGMNVLRQYMSVAIFLWCYPLARQRKWIPYCILVAIAAWFHQSAWMMLLMYPILRRRQFDVWTILIVIGAIFLLVNFESVMTSILPNTNYDNYLDDILNGKYGVKWIRIAAWLVPYIIVLFSHKFFRWECGVEYDVLYSVLLAACISVVSSQYVFAARIETYFSLMSYLAIIKIPERFVKRQERLVQIAMVMLFFIFGLYQYWISPAYHNILFESISGTL